MKGVLSPEERRRYELEQAERWLSRDPVQRKLVTRLSPAYQARQLTEATRTAAERGSSRRTHLPTTVGTKTANPARAGDAKPRGPRGQPGCRMRSLDMFWDGERWVPEGGPHPTTRPARRHDRLPRTGGWARGGDAAGVPGARDARPRLDSGP